MNLLLIESEKILWWDIYLAENLKRCVQAPEVDEDISVAEMASQIHWKASKMGRLRTRRR